MWLATFDVIEDHPGGVGAYGFQALSPLYVEAYLFDQGQTQKAIHSAWFQSLSELGWPGPILVVCLVISCFRVRSPCQILKPCDTPFQEKSNDRREEGGKCH